MCVLLAQAAEVHHINNCMIPGESCEGSAVAAMAVEVLMVPPGPVARTRAGSSWWPE